MVVRLNRRAKTAQTNYVTAFEEQQNPSGQVRALVETYDPLGQAVLLFLEVRVNGGERVIPQDGAVAAIVNIETKH